MNNKNPLNLKRSEKIFVAVTAILGIVLDFGSAKLLGFVMPIGKDLAIIWGILRVLGNLMFSSVLAFIFIKQIKLFRRTGFTLKKTLLIIADALLVVFLIGLNVWRYTAIRDFNQYLESWNTDISSRLINKMGQDLPPEKRSRLSFLNAQGIFVEEGRRIDYLSPNGRLIEYDPTPEDHANRNVRLFLQTQSSYEGLIATISSLSLFGALLGALLLGFMPRKEVPVTQ